MDSMPDPDVPTERAGARRELDSVSRLKLDVALVPRAMHDSQDANWGPILEVDEIASHGEATHFGQQLIALRSA
jgi:hypothetical protein